MPPKDYFKDYLKILQQYNNAPSTSVRDGRFEVSFRTEDIFGGLPKKPLTLEQAYNTLKWKSGEGSPFSTITVLAKNPNYKEPKRNGGKLEIKPITKTRLNEIDIVELDKTIAKNKSNTFYIIAIESLIQCGNDYDRSFDTEENREIVRKLFEKYNNQIFDIRL